MKNITVGTTVTITQQGSHYLALGTDAKVLSVDGGGNYHVEGTMGDDGLRRVIQLVSEKDFVVKAQPQSKGDDTLTNTFEVGQKVRITGATVDRMASLMTGEEVTSHSLPIGAVTTIVEVENEDGYAKLSVDGLTMTHRFAKEGPQWVKFEQIEDATGKDLSVDGEGEVEIAKGDIKVGDEVLVLGNRPCVVSKMLLGVERGMHGVEIGRTLKVLSVDKDKVIVDSRFEVLADDNYNQERQAIPLEYVMLASARTDSATA